VTGQKATAKKKPQSTAYNKKGFFLVHVTHSSSTRASIPLSPLHNPTSKLPLFRTQRSSGRENEIWDLKAHLLEVTWNNSQVPKEEASSTE
jgi:hypothetical protein